MNWDNLLLSFIMQLDEADKSYEEGMFEAHLLADDLVAAAKQRKEYASGRKDTE